MSNNDKEWLDEVRGEFESVINYRGTIRYSNGIYADNRLHQKWVGYRTRAQADRDKITELTALINDVVKDQSFPDFIKHVQDAREKLKEMGVKE